MAREHQARRGRRRGRASNGGGDPELVGQLATDYRLWARLPTRVRALLVLGDPHASTQEEKVLAVIGRPTFPPGVCTGCGCSELDACVVDEGLGPEGCQWIDRTRRRCTACGPAPAARVAS